MIWARGPGVSQLELRHEFHAAEQGGSSVAGQGGSAWPMVLFSPHYVHNSRSLTQTRVQILKVPREFSK